MILFINDLIYIILIIKPIIIYIYIFLLKATVIKSLKVNKAKPLIAGILSQIIIVPLIGNNKIIIIYN